MSITYQRINDHCDELVIEMAFSLIHDPDPDNVVGLMLLSGTPNGFQTWVDMLEEIRWRREVGLPYKIERGINWIMVV